MANEESLAKKLTRARSPEDAFQTVLRTSDRVLARITDGIYRQPGSALRELLANAYDADATRVTVSTDRPRFRTIRVHDNGIGMSPEMIQYVLENIGGSSKRVVAGAELGVTSNEDHELSPGGRRLIGKIGIGLFSVSQLARNFHIVTKQAKDEYYSIIQFLLKHYADDGRGDETGQREAGLALLWQEKARDPSAHGTTVVLDPVRTEAINRLRSADEWELLDAQEGYQRRKPPTFHIGRITSESDEHLYELESGRYSSIPWNSDDDPATAFTNLIQAVHDVAGASQNNTKLEGICDRYLRMVWDLSLALPLQYVGSDPIYDPLEGSVRAYRLANDKKAAIKVCNPQKPLAHQLKLGSSTSTKPGFQVVLDDLELARPLTFGDFPTTQRAWQDPLLLCQHVSETFEGASPELSGGPLEFHAYLLWAPKLVPRDRAGALVRIHGSSGTGFDDSFLRYQTRERIRLGQTSCEIFVTQGLEGALNIDRESFNYAHPHVIYLSKWLHGALTRLFTEEKRLASELRSRRRADATVKRRQTLDRVVENTWQRETGTDEEIPVVAFWDEGDKKPDEAASLPADSYRLRRPRIRGVVGLTPGPISTTTELEAILKVLASFGLLDLLDENARQRLATALAEVLEVMRNG